MVNKNRYHYIVESKKTPKAVKKIADLAKADEEEIYSPEGGNGKDNVIFDGYVDFSKLGTTASRVYDQQEVTEKEYEEYKKSIPECTDDDDPGEDYGHKVDSEIVIEDLLYLQERIGELTEDLKGITKSVNDIIEYIQQVGGIDYVNVDFNDYDYFEDEEGIIEDEYLQDQIEAAELRGFKPIAADIDPDPEAQAAYSMAHMNLFDGDYDGDVEMFKSFKKANDQPYKYNYKLGCYEIDNLKAALNEYTERCAKDIVGRKRPRIERNNLECKRCFRRKH